MINTVIDLSHHNTVSNWNRVAGAGIQGVIHKATQGSTGRDQTYAGRVGRAKAAGLMWGAYHFGTGSNGVTQAEHFLDVVRPDATTLMVLDFEPNLTGPSMTLIEAHAFVTHVHNVTGRWPGFYSGHSIKQLLGTNADPILRDCWFWLAQYGPTAVVPPCWPTWTMWQYTDGSIGPEPHTVNSIGHCDRDKFNGGEAGLRRLWGFAD